LPGGKTSASPKMGSSKRVEYAFEKAATAISPLVNISCGDKNFEPLFSNCREARKRLLKTLPAILRP